jgi:hypothetical protein
MFLLGFYLFYRNALQDVKEVQAQTKTKIGRLLGKEREDLVKDAQCIFTV